MCRAHRSTHPHAPYSFVFLLFLFAFSVSSSISSASFVFSALIRPYVAESSKVAESASINARACSRESGRFAVRIPCISVFMCVRACVRACVLLVVVVLLLGPSWG